MARSQMEYEPGDPRAGHSALSESVPGGSGPAQVPNTGSLLTNLGDAASAAGQAAGQVPAAAVAVVQSGPGALFAKTALGLLKGAADPAAAVKAAEGFGTVILAGLTTDPPAAPPPIYAPVRVPPMTFGELPPRADARPDSDPADADQPYSAGRGSLASSHTLIERIVAWWLRRPLG
jgi:hypothetical protein